MYRSDLVDIRPMVPEDKNFILATMLRGLFYGDSIFSKMKKQTFMLRYRVIAENLVLRNQAYTKIACLKDDPNVILGYAILNEDNSVLSWCFVKKSWRKIGIAKSLVPPTVRTVAHLTKLGESLIKNKGVDFDPFLL